MMEKRLDGIQEHELTKHLVEYELMKDEVLRLSEPNQVSTWKDPNHEQLAIFFEALNGI